MLIVKKETETLIARLKARDAAAISELYDLYSKALYNVVFRIVKTPEVAEDILQESFVKIWLNIDSYDAGKGTLFTWMLNISRNLSIDYIRSSHHTHQVRSVSTEEGISFFADHSSSTQPDYIGIKELVLTLNPDQLQAVNMLYFNGYTHTEAAEELNIPLGTLKTRVRTALKILRNFFDLNR